MNRGSLLTALLGFFSIILFNWSCTKLDTTSLGSDLLPVVDNVNTFADTIDVRAFQGIFNDTTSLTRQENQVVGKITADPLFGTTQANAYVQFKPAVFPYSIASPGDTLIGLNALDSVILCLAFKGSWGDTTVPMHLQVREIPSTTGGLWDSLYKAKYLTYAPIPEGTGNLVGDQTFDIRHINDQVKFAHDKDSVSGQIRIKLSSAYANQLFLQDSAATTGAGYQGNAFHSDSLFKKNFKGLAIEAISGNALMTLSFADPKTRLEVHFRKKRHNEIDTTYSTINIVSTDFSNVSPSAVANKVVRDYSGVPFQAVPHVEKDEIYLQTTPGTFAELILDSLNSFRNTNKIIHLARLRITEIPDPTGVDKVLTPPAFLYLDLRDSTTVVNYKPVYFDLNPTIPYNPDNIPAGSYYPSSVEYGYYGGYQKKMYEAGNEISYYDFNLTRYIQQMVTHHNTNYSMRLFAPYSFSYPQYSSRIIGYANNLADGRVKVGGTNGPRKMQMIIVWSKVNTP